MAGQEGTAATSCRTAGMVRRKTAVACGAVGAALATAGAPPLPTAPLTSLSTPPLSPAWPTAMLAAAAAAPGGLHAASACTDTRVRARHTSSSSSMTRAPGIGEGRGKGRGMRGMAQGWIVRELLSLHQHQQQMGLIRAKALACSPHTSSPKGTMPSQPPGPPSRRCHHGAWQEQRSPSST